MKVVVDTCIWSFALRRADVPEDPYTNELRELIHEVRVQMIGPFARKSFRVFAPKTNLNR